MLLAPLFKGMPCRKKRVLMLGGIPRIYNKKAVYAVKALIRLQLS